MRRLPRVTAAEVERALLKAGFRLLRTRGSHRSYVRGNRTVIVAHHPGRIIPPGTLRGILKRSGLSADEFEELRS